MAVHANQPTIIDQLTSFGKGAAVTTGGLLLGCWVGREIGNDMTFTVAGALTAIAIDHYYYGGNDDPCVARKIGYAIPILLLAKATNDSIKRQLAQAEQPDPSVFYADTDNILQKHLCDSRNKAVLFKLAYFACQKNKRPLDPFNKSSIDCAMTQANIIDAIDSIDEITSVKVVRIGNYKIVLDDPTAIDYIVKIWKQRKGRERTNIIDGRSNIIIV